MIDLAPGQKQSFLARNPILLACGVVGHGDAPPYGVRTAALGGIVVGPFGTRDRRRSAGVRVAEMNWGVVMSAGAPRRHAGRMVQRYERNWRQFGCPIIAHIADDQADDAARTAAHLSAANPAALEVLIPNAAERSTVRFLIRSVVESSDAPVWAKLPLHDVERAAERAVDEGASGLVIGQAPIGALPRATGTSNTGALSTIVRGEMMGPAGFALMLESLLRVKALALPCALIACGGVHTLDQARTALDAGADAIQIDGAAWIEPGLVNALVDAFEDR